MLRFSLTLAAAAFAASALANTAEAGGCHGGFGGGFRQSYAYSQPSYSAQRQIKERRALAAAKARAQSRAIAARQVAPQTNVATATPIAPAADKTAVASTTTDLKKSDLKTTTTIAKTVATTANKDDTETVVAQVCRKFSPAVGGLVDTACN